MRRREVCLLVGLVLGLASCATPSSHAPPLRVEPDPAAPFDDTLPAQPGKTAHPPRPWAFDVRHYDIAIALDFQARALSGTVRVRLVDLEDGVPELRLDAAEMSISDVRASGPIGTWVHEGDQLTITLPGGSRAGTEREIEIHWTCTPSRGAHFQDAPPGAPEWGAQVWTQGECEDTRYWLPCHDAPDDRATHAIAVTVPSGMTVTAAGRRNGVVDDGERATWRFVMDTPHVAYLTTFVAGDLQITEQSGAVPLEIVANERDTEHAVHSLRRTADVLRFFGELTGRAYPYPRYAQCCVRDFVFGGMENISATTLTDTTVHPPEWEPARSSDGLVAHEAAHQWFGDLLTCAHWSDVWLNEGFATYMTLLWKEHDEGRDAFLAAVRGTMNGALGACERARRPVVSDVYAEPFDLFFDGHAYGGGAARLHALRVEVGDDAFFRAIRLYVARNAGTCVTTSDLEEAVSEAAGRDMTWWFDQWLRKPGRPKLQVRWAWDAAGDDAGDDAGGVLRLTVRQTHDEKAFPAAYRLPLDVVCEPAGGGEPVRRRFTVTEREHVFEIDVPAAPGVVRLDPDRGLLARLDVARSVPTWLGLLTAGSAADRLDAVVEVARASRESKEEAVRVTARRALRDVALRDPLAGVRRAAVDELRKRRSAFHRDALTSVLRGDPDLGVRIAAADGLGEWVGDADAALALRGVLAGHGDLLTASALCGLAKMNDAGIYERLVAALSTPSWQSRVRGAALDGLADLGDERAFSLLVAAAAPDADPWTRDEALSALGRMGRARPEYTEAVLAQLRDPRGAVRDAAARALGALGDPGAVPALLAAFDAEGWPGTQRHLRSAIEACRKAAAEVGEPVTTGAARAIAARIEHAALRDRADDEGKRRAAELRRELDTLRVPPLPRPKK